MQEPKIGAEIDNVVRLMSSAPDNAMTTTQSRPSATIYQFPVGGRGSLTPRRDETPATEFSVSNVAAGALGSAWYHEAAIQDSERAHDH